MPTISLPIAQIFYQFALQIRSTFSTCILQPLKILLKEIGSCESDNLNSVQKRPQLVSCKKKPINHYYVETDSQTDRQIDRHEQRDK